MVYSCSGCGGGSDSSGIHNIPTLVNIKTDDTSNTAILVAFKYNNKSRSAYTTYYNIILY